jgi:hypothetical protein
MEIFNNKYQYYIIEFIISDTKNISQFISEYNKYINDKTLFEIMENNEKKLKNIEIQGVVKNTQLQTQLKNENENKLAERQTKSLIERTLGKLKDTFTTSETSRQIKEAANLYKTELDTYKKEFMEKEESIKTNPLKNYGCSKKQFIYLININGKLQLYIERI